MTERPRLEATAGTYRQRALLWRAARLVFVYHRRYEQQLAALALLVSAALSADPVLYIDDRWLYDVSAEIGPIVEFPLNSIAPIVLRDGLDITIAASGYSTELSLQASELLANSGVSAEVIDIRSLNPYDPTVVNESVVKTGRLLVVDSGWASCGFSSELITSATISLPPQTFKTSPKRVTLPPCPAPTSSTLETAYYPTVLSVVNAAQSLLS